MCIALATTVVFGQTGATTGQIRGTIAGDDGTPLPGVTVTVTNTETGSTRSAVTDSNGEYLVSLLRPGSYRVHAELAGFGEARNDRVTVLLGTASTINLRITPQLAQEITVTASAPLVDTTQSDLTAAVTEFQIESLPILGRDFRDLALLTPGVVTTFGERVAANGARGVSTDYNIDGADANSDFFGEQRGGTRAPYTFSQAAIQEFQVIRSAYSAEYAKGVGATLNAITKSGTNEIKGQGFYYKRDADWASSRPRVIDGLNVSDSFDPKDIAQYGFALGGPIVQDRVHFFINADLQDFSRAVVLNDVRQNTAFLALPEATRAATIARVESLVGNPIADEFRFTTTEDQQVYLIKLDANLASNHHLSFRDNYSTFENFGSEGVNALRSNQGVFKNDFNSAVLQAESVLTPSMFNQIILQVSKEERPRDPLSTAVPRTFIGGINLAFGQSDFLPNDLIEDRRQLKENFSLLMGDHHIKTGFEIIETKLDNLFPRNFAGNWDFSNAANFVSNTPSRFRQGLGPVGIERGNNRFDYTYYGAFIQNSMRLSSQLTLDVGLRYDTQTVPKPIRNVAPEFPEFLTNFQRDKDNWAPRLGFAYDLFGTGSSVLRGGAGLYYNYIPSILFADPLGQIGGLFSQVDINCTTSTLCPVYPGVLGRAEFEAAARTSATIRTVSKDLEAMESTRTSLGYEQQIGTSYSVSLEGSYAKLDKQQRMININAVPTGLRYGDLVVYSNNNPARPYTRFTDVTEHRSDAEGDYKAVTLSTKKLATGGSKYSWLAHYTWSEAIDQDSNERSTSSAFTLDPFNAKLNEGRADYDVTHKVVLSGTYEAPLGILISGIYNWRSGIPFTRTVSGLGNGLGGIGVFTPVFVDSSGNVIDLTAATGLSRAGLSAFLQGATMEERNRHDQPDFSMLDMRIAKRFPVIRNFELELIGEIFNVLNTKNEFVPGANRSLFLGSFSSSQDRWTFTRNANFGKTNSYTGDPRQYQLALKVIF
ncbi:MAG TPA: TonB-dependent receptor [Thermoanaerobaculia bacterium]|nr:TonB-dependent receptor [Thermoanaerobaculia bacterium]